MLKEIITKTGLEKLANKSAPTWEGVDLDGLEEYLKEIDPKVEIAYCTGETYNKAYKLTEDNAYPDDLTIVFLDNWSIPMSKWKFSYGCRWADDVKDNNIRRQKEINRGAH